MAEAKLPDINTLLQAGINPKTGLPLKFGTESCELKNNIRKQLRILDEQNAINRYVWHNLPKGLNAQMIERILYYKGQACFFYMEETESFYFLPYALDGTIDVYGRFTGVTPLPFNGSSSIQDGGKVKPWIQGYKKTPIYDVVYEDEDIPEDWCVLLSDYSKQMSETNIPRQIIQEPILDAMGEAIPFARTALLVNTGIKGVRVQDQDQASSVDASGRAMVRNALNGNPWLPIVGSVEFQELGGQGAYKSEEYLLYLQALDNYRLSLYGLGSGGLFQKKAHMLEAEQEQNQGSVRQAYQDGLTLRQHFCDIVNSIVPLGIWCEASETVIDKMMTPTDENNQPLDVEEGYKEEGGDEDVSM